MANTFTQIYFHLVFTTKERRPLIQQSREEELFRYIWGINKQLKCHLYRINGIEDHVHILTHLHPIVSLANYVKNVKTGSSRWIRENQIFSGWVGWQDGYAAISHCRETKDQVAEYIKGQREHHKKESSVDEYRRLLKEAGINFDERYL